MSHKGVVQWTRRGAVLGTVGLCASLGAAGAARAQSKLAFSSTRDGVEIGNAEIYVMRSDGSSQTRLTFDTDANLASDVEPTWSPDATRLAWTRIAFSATRVQPGDIWTMSADGSGQTPLTSGPDHDTGPSWSPDGTRVAFTRRPSSDPGNADVYVINADGTGEQRLTTDPAFDGEPTWAPDGTRIAFTSDRDGNVDIYTMAADGTDQTRLTFSDATDNHPAWAPIGRPIAFLSDRDGFAQVYVVPPDHDDPRRVTSGVEGPGMPAANWAPAWSPRAGYLAYTADTDVGFEILRIGLRGGEPTPLTSDPAPDFGPAWSTLIDSPD
jgi:Tol biopolymer transport system component